MFNSQQTLDRAKKFAKTLRAGSPWWWICALLLALLPVLWLPQSHAKEDAQTRPNIVVLLADDAGYADFGAFGGEARTPNINALAARGMKLTNFHAMPTCSPTRSVLLTGVVTHLNGFGTMAGNVTHNPLDAQTGQPGYGAHLNNRVITGATLLKAAGYHTYHVGKWHLAEEEEDPDGQTIFLRGTWPIDQGFEKSYGMLDGGSEHFGRPGRVEGGLTTFVENDTIITGQLPADYFSAKAHTDKALEYIAAGRMSDGGQRKPFFLYYADTLPHEPNQVPDEFIKQEYIDLYYAKGWDAMRADRLQRMKALGLLPASVTLANRIAAVPDWNNVNDPAWGPLMAQVTTPPYNVMWQINTVDELKRTLAKKYAVYTGMVEYFDDQVGRLVQYLRDTGEYDNTLFIFMSDNGGDFVPWDDLDRDFMLRIGIDNSYANIGRRNSFVSNGLGWAQVSNTPFDGAKVLMHEGGIRVPLVIAYGNSAIRAGSQSNALTSVADVAATILDYAGVRHPVGAGVAPSWAACTGSYQGKTGLCPMNGKSLRGILEGAATQLHENEPLAFELFGNANKALLLQEGETVWKIRKVGDFGFGRALNEPWQLFNLTTDLAEARDLSGANPEKLTQLINLYNKYEYDVGFVARLGQKKNAPAGTTVDYTFAVTNTSTVADSFSFVCQSAWPCTIVAPTSSVELAPNQSISVQLNIRIPSGAARGVSNTAQLNVLRANRPAFSRNFTAVTVSGGAPVMSVSAASFMGTELAPESISAAFGSNLGIQVAVASSLPLPTDLAGTTVKLKDSAGVERPASLFFVAPDQVNFQVPPGAATGPAMITVTNGGGLVSTGTINIAMVAPGLFTANANGRDVPAAVALRLRANGTQSFEPVFRYDAAQRAYVAVPLDLGPAGDQLFLLLYGTGARFRSSLSAVRATIGGLNSDVLFAGAVSGLVGLDQFNVLIPRSLAGRGKVDLSLTVDSKTTNVVSVTFK